MPIRFIHTIITFTIQVVFSIAPRRLSSGKKRFSIPSFKNNYLKTLALSLALALFLVFSLYGLYGMVTGRTIPLPIALIFLIFAILFVVGYEFFSSRFVRRSVALAVGFLAALLVTILILALIEFAVMVIDGAVSDIGWERFVIAVAFCLIISVIFLKYAENL